MPARLRRGTAALGALALLCAQLSARDWIVAPSGGDFASIQAALDVAQAGDRVLVRAKPGGWREAVSFRRGGDPQRGPLVLMSYPGERATIDGTGLSAEVLVEIRDLSYLEVRNLELAHLHGISDGSGIRISGHGSHFHLSGNEIHDLRGRNAMGITVYGTSTSGSLSDLVIEANWIHHCEPAPSEALVLNGNVERFAVRENLVEDVNNIGIDFIGGESSIHPSAVARSGVCAGNVVRRARSIYGGGYGAGIYVDGGRDLLLERNWVEACDLGIEVGAENAGFDATNVVVRGNALVRNDKAGLVCGGYERRVGRVRACLFESNTCFENDTLRLGLGELWVQWADGLEFRSNVFAASAQGLLLQSVPQAVNLRFESNLWFAASASPSWILNGAEHLGIAAFRSAAGASASELYGDPRFADPARNDFAPLTGSPALESGGALAFADGLDLRGFARRSDGDLDGISLLDRGAFEACNAALVVSGELQPGTTIDARLEARTPLFAILLAGMPGPWLPLGSYGLLQLDPQQTLFAIPLGAAPATLPLFVPRELPPGSALGLQGFVWNGRAGNLSNAWLR
ncbi:MAG: right-handed parallel beta-helix repeat-containing protein [Planctomycetes bacterium]|nr:right-handed parallel beta-helix repeat-containing protein [Planctomycetota bacterium]